MLLRGRFTTVRFPPIRRLKPYWAASFRLLADPAQRCTFRILPFSGGITPTADGMTRLQSLDRVTPASHFEGCGTLSHASRSRISSKTKLSLGALPMANARRRNHNRWRRYLGIWCLQFSDLRRVKRVPASQTCQRAIFLSCTHIIARLMSLGKNRFPDPNSSGVKRQAAPGCRIFCCHSPGYHSPPPADRFRRSVRRRAGSPQPWPGTFDLRADETAARRDRTSQSCQRTSLSYLYFSTVCFSAPMTNRDGSQVTALPSWGCEEIAPAAVRSDARPGAFLSPRSFPGFCSRSRHSPWLAPGK